MKHLSRLAFLGLAFTLSACSKSDDTPPAPSANVRVQFQNFASQRYLWASDFGGSALNNTNAHGEPYSVDLLKYYVSHMTLIRDDNTEVPSAGHDLIDNADTSTQYVMMNNVPNGKYVAVRFYLGVDSAHNHSGDQTGDLDPVHGMIWSWNTGYIFYKHEGYFKDNGSQTRALAFHLGTDAALTTITVPLTGVTVDGLDKWVLLKFDMDKVYAGPPAMDFNEDNNRMSTSRADALWIGSMQKGMQQAFSFDKVISFE